MSVAEWNDTFWYLPTKDAIESWYEWDFNPQLLKSNQTF